MEIGIGSYAWRWAIGIGDAIPPAPLTPADLARRTHAHGLSLLQIADNMPLHLQGPERIDELDRAARELGVRLELGVGSMSGEKIAVYIGLAERLGATLIRIAPDRTDAQKPIAAVAAELRTLLPALRNAGVTLAIENHFYLPSPKLVKVVEAVADPALGVCLDVANSIAVEEWPGETIALLAPYAVNLHLKDYRIMLDPHGVGISFVGAPLGQGRTNIEAVFTALGRHGRDVSVILEHWLPRAATSEATFAAEDEWLDQSIAVAQQATAAHLERMS